MSRSCRLVLCFLVVALGCEGSDPEPLAYSITISPTSGLETDEGGGEASFAVVLSDAPTNPVTVIVASGDDTEGVVAPGSLTFTPDNWNAPQLVTVTGQDDSEADGDVEYWIVTEPATSNDGNYNGMDPADVRVINIDNESAGISIDGAEGLRTSETGSATSFTVVLIAAPNADVEIPLESGDTSEGAVSPASLTFTPQNWDAPQEVTITGVDDADQDGAVTFDVRTLPALSEDAGYDGLDADDVTVTNIDDESAGVSVTPTEGLVTTEGGEQANVGVVLNAAPASVVTISVASSDESEGTLDTDRLRFTPDNWNAPQSITVTGVDDDDVDGNQIYQVTFGATESEDNNYRGIAVEPVAMTNIDDESVGVRVFPTEGLTVSESGSEATFNVVLNRAPSGDVNIALRVDDATEGRVTPTSISFDGDSWNAPRVITVSGVNDDESDGHQIFRVELAPIESSDSAYDGIDPPDVEVRTLDDETSGVEVDPTEGLITFEIGSAVTFDVRLTAAPTANVRIPLVSSDPGEGAVSPRELTFTPDNWSARQRVTVTGQDDEIADGAQPYRILLGPAESADPGYDGLDPRDVQLVNNDDETAGITVRPTSGLEVTEAGGTAEFEVVLNSEPTRSVTINLVSTDASEGRAEPPALVFTPDNWSAPQRVLVRGQNDDIADRDQIFRIRTLPANSADGEYDSLDAEDVEVTNLDDESAGFILTPTTGLSTTEVGGTATFTVRLTSEPTANVMLALSSSDDSEGTVSPPTLNFEADSWDLLQTVTITGVDDDVADGTQSFFAVTAAAVSDDAEYDGLDPSNVEIENLDDETASVVVDRTEVLVDETGDHDTFSVTLSSQPLSTVTIAISSSDEGEGIVRPSELVFTTSDWGTAHEVVVTGVDDDIADGGQVFRVELAPAVSDDPSYAGMDGADVDGINEDDDTAGLLFDGSEPLVTTEAGGTDEFTVRLATEPISPVTLNLTVDDGTPGVPGPVTASPTAITFDSSNWDSPVAVTVTGLDDDGLWGDAPFRIAIELETSDSAYGALSMMHERWGINRDNDGIGVRLVYPDSDVGLEWVYVTEAGSSMTFEVTLNTAPSASVTIPIATRDAGEYTVSPSSLTFTPSNFATPQEITVTGVDDSIADADQVLSIDLGVIVSDDPLYRGIDAPDGHVVVYDDEVWTCDSPAGIGVPIVGESYGGVLFGSSDAPVLCGSGAGAEAVMQFEVPPFLSLPRIDFFLGGGTASVSIQGPSCGDTVSLCLPSVRDGDTLDIPVLAPGTYTLVIDHHSHTGPEPLGWGVYVNP